MNMQRFVLPLLITTLFIINRIALCNSAKFPDDGYVNPPPPPAEGYDVPEEPNEGYDAPSYEEETKGLIFENFVSYSCTNMGRNHFCTF